MAVTAVATTVSAAGVSLVTDRVTDDHTVLSTTDVVGLTEAPTTTAVTTAPAQSPTPPSARPAPTAPTSPPASRPSQPARPPAERTPDRRPDPTTSTATFSNRGGVVSVRCDGDAISLVSARPNEGYRLVVREDGPERVIVEFVSASDATALGAMCVDGAPVAKGATRSGDRTTTTTPPQ